MDRHNREQRRRVIKRRRIVIAGIVLLVFAFFSFGNYRSRQNMILKDEDYLNSENCYLYFLRDCDYLKIDDFSASDLNVAEGEKVSGYDSLTKNPVLVDSTYLTDEIAAIDELISRGLYTNWDTYSQDLQKVLSRSAATSQGDLDFFKATARYSPETVDQLNQDKTQLQQLNTGSPVQLTLNTFGLMKTGYIFANVSEYDQIACEAVLGDISNTMINDISHLSTEKQSAIRVVNNDHCYAVCSIDKDIPVQGEEKVNELKQEYQKNLNNSDYFEMLVTRVDRLRQYPTISFSQGDQTFPAYLVDIKEDASKKILVIMIKDYLQDLIKDNRISCNLNVQDYKAWIVPQSAIIKKDNKNYIQLLQKGYFTKEIEVNLALYDQGKAILRVDQNPDLYNGMTIKIHP